MEPGSRPEANPRGTPAAGGITKRSRLVSLVLTLVIAFLGAAVCSAVTGLVLSSVLPQSILRTYLVFVLFGLFFCGIFLYLAKKFQRDPPDLDNNWEIGDSGF